MKFIIFRIVAFNIWDEINLTPWKVTFGPPIWWILLTLTGGDGSIEKERQSIEYDYLEEGIEEWVKGEIGWETWDWINKWLISIHMEQKEWE